MRVRSERQGDRDVVGGGHELAKPRERPHLVDQAVRRRFALGPPPQAHDPHAEGSGPLRDGTADVAVAHDAQGAAVELLDVEDVPGTRGLARRILVKSLAK